MEEIKASEVLNKHIIKVKDLYGEHIRRAMN